MFHCTKWLLYKISLYNSANWILIKEESCTMTVWVSAGTLLEKSDVAIKCYCCCCCLKKKNKKKMVHTFWAYVQVQCSFTSTETVGAVRGGEPRTTTSAFTQLLSSDHISSMLLYVQWHHVLMFKFHVALRPQKLQELLGMGNPGRPSRLSHSSWALLRLYPEARFL